MENRRCRLEPAGLCGTSIDTENVIFGDRESNLVYMDKVFSFNSDTSCPVFFFLDTRCDSDDFEIKFTTADRGCGCGCNPCELDCNAVFEIENAFAVLDFIGIVPRNSPSQVTLTAKKRFSDFENGRHCRLSELVSRLQHPQCIDSNLPSKNSSLSETYAHGKSALPMCWKVLLLPAEGPAASVPKSAMRRMRRQRCCPQAAAPILQFPISLFPVPQTELLRK